MSTMTLSIQGMHCGACARRVTDQLKQLPGVEPQAVSVGSARIAYDPQQSSPAAVVAALDRIGFQAVPVSTGDQP